jgi:hypothetical protein
VLVLSVSAILWLEERRSHTCTALGNAEVETKISEEYACKEDYAVAQLVQALRYNPEGCGLDSRWGHFNFSLTYSFWPHYDFGVDSASNRNEYQGYVLGGKGGRCVGSTTLPPRNSGSLNLLEP